MRIAVSNFDILQFASGDATAAKLLSNMLERNFKVIWIAPSTKRLKQPNTIVVRVPKTRVLFQLPFWLLQLPFVCLREKFDLILCCNEWYEFPIFYLFSKLRNYKILFQAGGILSEGRREMGRPGFEVKIIKILEKFIMKHAHTVIAHSQNTVDFYSRYSKHIELVTTPIDTDSYKFDAEGRERWRQYYRIPSSHKVIGIIGPFAVLGQTPAINLAFLEFLYKNLDNFDKGILFMVIGECPKRLRKNGGRIIYTGYVEDFIGHLSCLDAVLIPSRMASTGPFLKTLEPMSLSLPVFTTPKGALALYYIELGRDIFVFPEEELAENINRIIHDDALLKQVGRNARQAIEKYYSQKVNASKLVEIVKELTSRSV